MYRFAIFARVNVKFFLSLLQFFLTIQKIVEIKLVYGFESGSFDFDLYVWVLDGKTYDLVRFSIKINLY